MDKEFEQNDLIPAERQRQMLEYIRKHKSAGVSRLSQMMYINEATIRRDLNALEKTGLVKRTYGGAVLSEGIDSEIPLFVRDTENREKKEIIGERAANLVRDGDTLFLDSSSTTSRIIPHLSDRKGLKIITNGAKTTILLSKLACSVYCTGGRLRENSLSFIGQSAIDCLRNFYVDTAFFSCRGLSSEFGMTDSNEDEALLRRMMIEHSRKSYLLIDSTKLNKSSFYAISPLSSLTGIICDIELPPELRR